MEEKNSIPLVGSLDWFSLIVIAIGERLGPDANSAWAYQSGKCLYKLRRSQYHLRKIRAIYSTIEKMAPDSFPVRIGVKGGRPVEELFYSYYEGPLTAELFFTVDSFFEASRSCIDFSLDMLGSARILRNPPSSMKRAVRNIQRYRRESGEQLADAMLSLWETWGLTAKNYRDCFAHYAALSGVDWAEAINIKCEGNVTSARLFLPDNPSANRNALFTYKDNVDAREITAGIMAGIEHYMRTILTITANKFQIGQRVSVKTSSAQHNVAVGTW